MDMLSTYLNKFFSLDDSMKGTKFIATTFASTTTLATYSISPAHKITPTATNNLFDHIVCSAVLGCMLPTLASVRPTGHKHINCVFGSLDICP